MNVPSIADSLAHWLEWLEALHPSEIEMGLDRVGKVADRAKLRPASMPVILVGGTNGKGSTVALLTAMYSRAGFTVGTYTSPHIERFNERMCINGSMLDDASIVAALDAVEQHRAPELLTYFEYTTLAAMFAFKQAQCDLVILEVGLGGRLDATNVWDADCAIITSVALDHQDYLGDTRDEIGLEKIAIGRTGKPVVMGEIDPPASMLDAAKSAGMVIVKPNFDHLPSASMSGEHQARNAACAVLCVEAMSHRLRVEQAHIQWALSNVSVPGRFEQLQVAGVSVVLDVGHNPAAAKAVNQAVLARFPVHEVHMVVAIMHDKDIAAVARELQPSVTHWYCAALDEPRAADTALISSQLPANVEWVSEHASVGEAFEKAHSTVLQQLESGKQAIILVGGSFFTVSAIRAHWHNQHTLVRKEQ